MPKIHNDVPALIVQDLSKSVKDSQGDLCILDAINFTIPRGQSVAITGSSGSGKSTLLGLMAGLDSPTHGEVTLLGHALSPLTEDRRAEIRATMTGFVFQSFQLLPHLTALENVMLPLELQGIFDQSTAKKILAEVGLNHRLSHYPKTLSGGEQQRVSLARAFIQEPAILFADEPTGSLDSQTGRVIMDLMFKLHAEHGNTMVLVTHDLTLAQRCQRQITLADGKIIHDTMS